MLVVIGLNHQTGACIDCGVDAAGMDRLGQAIFQAWPEHPERLVIVSSSFRAPCTFACSLSDPPAPPEALIRALQARYGVEQAFSLREQQASPTDAKWGTLGIIAGSRWSILSSRHHQFHEGAVEVWIKDTATQTALPVYAMHTNFDNEQAVDDLVAATRAAVAEVGTRAVPILAGDFNFTRGALESPEGHPPGARTIRENLNWVNQDVACSPAPGPGHVFQTQEGNMMHAFTGRIQAAEAGLAFECASAELQPVRLSYSVDASGNLAVRPGDDRPAIREGIILDDIAHNVIAMGLRIRPRTDPTPASCTGPKCPSNRPWCFCSASCETKSKCAELCTPESCCPPTSIDCGDCRCVPRNKPGGCGEPIEG